MSDPRDLNALFSRGKAKTRTSLLRQSIRTDLKLLPPEVKAVEKETLKKKVCLTLYSISFHFTFISILFNFKSTHDVATSFSFFFPFSKFWLVIRFIFIDEQKPIQFLVFSVKQIRNTADKVGAQTATETQRGPANKTWVPLQHFQTNLLRSYIQQIDAGYRNS